MRRRPVAIMLAAAVVLAAFVIGFFVFQGSSQTLTAYFPRVTGIYAGSSVRILGVPVGKVSKLTVQGTRVRVDITYDSKYRLPADVDAVIVPPSIVSDRYIALSPVYTGGAVLADGGTIPESRTQVPVELDQIFSEINQLNVALGPKGANSKGALSRLLQVSAANLNGNGTQFNTTINKFSQLITTLADNRGAFFTTLANLEKFTSTLASDDGGVRAVSGQLAAVSGQLNSERTDLALAMRNLSVALGQVATFVHDNRSTLTSDIAGITQVSSALLTQKKAIEEFLDEAPLALENLALTYDPASQTLRTRNNSSEYLQASPTSPLSPLCQLAQSLKVSCSTFTPPSSGSSSPGVPGVPPVPSGASSAAGALQGLLGVKP